MKRIMKYECRRLIWNRFFFGFLGIFLFYGWQVLKHEILPGVAGTAPFSPWSFGSYLSRMVPFLWAGTLLFLTFFTSRKARRAAVLTDASPADPRRYGLARCAAVLTGAGLLTLACLGEAAFFYGRYVHWGHWETLLAPALTVLPPVLALALGGGWFLGRLRPWLMVLWMALPFLWMALPLPSALGIWNGSFFTEYPLTLGSLDPGFSLPGAVAAAQGAALGVGGMAFLASFWGNAGSRRRRGR